MQCVIEFRMWEDKQKKAKEKNEDNGEGKKI